MSYRVLLLTRFRLIFVLVIMLLSAVESQAQNAVRFFNVTGYRVSRYHGADDSNYVAGIDLYDGESVVGNLVFMKSPPTYGYYNQSGDQAYVPYDQEEFAEILDLLRHHEINLWLVQYDEEFKIAYSTLTYTGITHSATDTPVAKATTDKPLSPEPKRFEVKNGVLRRVESTAAVRNPYQAKPAREIPKREKVDSVDRVYFVRQKLFNLKTKLFTQVFFDTPKAVAVADEATQLGADADFYYYRVTTFGREFHWAFSIQPAGSYKDHTIWSRPADGIEWNMEEGEVVMADLRSSRLP